MRAKLDTEMFEFETLRHKRGIRYHRHNRSSLLVVSQAFTDNGLIAWIIFLVINYAN